MRSAEPTLMAWGSRLPWSRLAMGLLVGVLAAPSWADALSLHSGPFVVPPDALRPTGGSLIYEQLPDGVTSLASQLDACEPFLAECTDDFVGDGSTVESVAWWGRLWAPTDDTIDGVFIRILAATSEGAPGTILAETHVVGFGATGDELVQYQAVLETPFDTAPGETYFLSIVVEHCSPPQWGWATGSGNGEMSWFRSEFFGYPDWTAAYDVYGVAHELAFRLTGLPVPVLDVSWSLLKTRFR